MFPLTFSYQVFAVTFGRHLTKIGQVAGEGCIRYLAQSCDDTPRCKAVICAPIDSLGKAEG